MMQDEGWMMKDSYEGQWWRMNVDDFKLLRGFASWQTDRLPDKQTDICECRVAFATENKMRDS